MNPIYLKSFIEKAIKDEQYLKIDYVDSKSKITKNRIIEPMEMKKDGDMYDRVIARDVSKDDMRSFLFLGIQKIAIAKLGEL